MIVGESDLKKNNLLGSMIYNIKHNKQVCIDGKLVSGNS